MWEIVAGSRYVVISCDEITMIDNQLWITINCYVVQNWCCLFLLISLKHVIERRGFDHLIKVIVDSLKKHVGVFDANVAAILLSFGVDGVNVL